MKCTMHLGSTYAPAEGHSSALSWPAFQSQGWKGAGSTERYPSLRPRRYKLGRHFSCTPQSPLSGWTSPSWPTRATFFVRQAKLEFGGKTGGRRVVLTVFFHIWRPPPLWRERPCCTSSQFRPIFQYHTRTTCSKSADRFFPIRLEVGEILSGRFFASAGPDISSRLCTSGCCHQQE